MKNKLLRVSWGGIAVFLQLFAVWVAYYLYSNDFGYGHGREFSYSLSFSYWVLGGVGFLGILCSFIGMYSSIIIDKKRWLTLKLPLIYLPCMFLSVVWLYTCLVLLAWV